MPRRVNKVKKKFRMNFILIFFYQSDSIVNRVPKPFTFRLLQTLIEFLDCSNCADKFWHYKVCYNKFLIKFENWSDSDRLYSLIFLSICVVSKNPIGRVVSRSQNVNGLDTEFTIVSLWLRILNLKNNSFINIH